MKKKEVERRGSGAKERTKKNATTFVPKGTYNYPMDSHKEFCKRCLKVNKSICPMTGTKNKYHSCRV